VTIRKETRGGKPRWVIDIPYRTAAGRKERYRRDAQVQTKAAAEAEHRRLLAELATSGSLRVEAITEPASQAAEYTFAEAVKYYRATQMQTGLKPSTRASYNRWLDAVLVPRFGAQPLHALDGRSLGELDAELVADELTPSTRANIQCVYRSVLRCAVAAGFLAVMPAMPRLPKIGRRIVRPMPRSDLDTLLALSAQSARLAFALIAFAGLRPCEIRGLRWTDVDLVRGTVTIRRGITRGEETTPKSHHQRAVPIAAPLRRLLEPAAKQKANPWSPVALTARGQPWGEFGLNQAFRRVLKRAKITGWTVYSLRHFFVTELFRLRAPAPTVQRLAGHSDLATTQRYADVDASDLRAAIELFNGNDVEMAK
jgi:integrase